MKKKLHVILSLSLLLLFAGYCGSTLFFNHTHTIDGVTITHSHPFNKQSAHHHSDGAYVAIQVLAHLIFSLSISFLFAFKNLPEFIHSLFCRVQTKQLSDGSILISLQRPPPYKA